MPRLFDATSGAVLVDGVDVRELDPDLLRGQYRPAPQKPYLFSGTVRSNLLYELNATLKDELWRALSIAQAEGFVREMDGGLDAPRLAGRHQRLRRAAAADRDRPGAREAARALHF